MYLARYWFIGLIALFLTGCSGGQPTTEVETAVPSESPTTVAPDAPTRQPTESEQATATPMEEPEEPLPAVTEPPSTAEPAARPQLVEFYADW